MKIIMYCSKVEYYPNDEDCTDDEFVYQFKSNFRNFQLKSHSKISKFDPGDTVSIDINKLTVIEMER